MTRKGPVRKTEHQLVVHGIRVRMATLFQSSATVWPNDPTFPTNCPPIALSANAACLSSSSATTTPRRSTRTACHCFGSQSRLSLLDRLGRQGSHRESWTGWQVGFELSSTRLAVDSGCQHGSGATVSGLEENPTFGGYRVNAK